MAAATLLLAACGDVVPEEGTAPVALEVNLGGVTGLGSLNECILSQATALLYFDGNLGLSSGDYTSRVLWSSSDAGVVTVSNGEIPAASGGYYAPGVLVPRRTGLAQITATYLDFRATLDLEVQPVLLAMTPERTDIAERSTESFGLEITTASGLEVTAAEGVRWVIDQATSNARVDGNGLLTANSAAADRFTLRAQPVGCDRSVTQSLKVSAIDRLELVREQPEGAPLPLGISDLLRIEARFAGDGSLPQDLTRQMEFEADDDDVLLLAMVGDALQVTGQEVGSSGAEARFEPDGGSALSLRLPDYTVRELDATGLSLSPEELRLVYPATGELMATATYEDGITRPVSRHADWSSSDASRVSISTGGESFGTANIANSNYSGQVYAVFEGYTAATRILAYRNDGP